MSSLVSFAIFLRYQMGSIDFEAIGNAISEGASNTGKAISELGKA